MKYVKSNLLRLYNNDTTEETWGNEVIMLILRNLATMVARRIESEVIFGREPVGSNTIVCNGSYISRNHAKISKGLWGSYLLQDLSSTNGTFINNRQIPSGEHMVGLTIGDVITLGGYTTHQNVESFVVVNIE